MTARGAAAPGTPARPAAGSAADLVAPLDWPSLAEALDRDDHAVIPGCLDDALIDALVDALAPGCRPRVDAGGRERRPVDAAERAVTAALGARLDAWHAALGPPLARLAQAWDARVGCAGPVPALLPPRPCLDRVPAGERRPLCGDPAATIGGTRLPFRWVALLGQPGRDFDGGECILTERRPRMQSRAIVVPLRRGDAALLVRGQRARLGTRGGHVVESKVAIGPVRAGERIGLEMVFDRVQAVR